MKKWTLKALLAAFCFIVGWETAAYVITQNKILENLEEIKLTIKR